MKDITKILRAKGLKVTPQRIAIYAMLSHTKEHPNAEMIYQALEPTNPTLSLATVYKTLCLFKSCGLVQELSVGEPSARYDAITQTHPHAVCTCCGKVADIPYDILERLHQQACRYTDFPLESEQLIFYGKCPDCKA